jgi:hypothetical protein
MDLLITGDVELDGRGDTATTPPVVSAAATALALGFRKRPLIEAIDSPLPRGDIL